MARIAIVQIMWTVAVLGGLTAPHRTEWTLPQAWFAFFGTLGIMIACIAFPGDDYMNYRADLNFWAAAALATAAIFNIVGGTQTRWIAALAPAAPATQPPPAPPAEPQTAPAQADS